MPVSSPLRPIGGNTERGQALLRVFTSALRAHGGDAPASRCPASPAMRTGLKAMQQSYSAAVDAVWSAPDPGPIGCFIPESSADSRMKSSCPVSKNMASSAEMFSQGSR
jgi:hypothetical protein